MKAKAFGLAACLALACGASAPAEAQFAYPVIVVPPPQVQTVIVPKSPTTTQLNRQYPPSPESPTDKEQCTYQGRVKTCH
jgi:hypothetical protein